MGKNERDRKAERKKLRNEKSPEKGSSVKRRGNGMKENGPANTSNHDHFQWKGRTGKELKSRRNRLLY